jgi:ABC-type branched-subunit amino acid transport system substrate-binding protein
VKYVNKTKMLAPWRKEKFPADITLELLWRDDELKPPKALSIYEELKAKGILVYRCSGTPIALALMDKLNEDRMGAVSMATGPYLLAPPKTVFTMYPIYTDEGAAVADWFKERWKEKRKPRFAYLTADHPFGRSVELPELTEYVKKLGYEIVGSQYVPIVATAPPTTQLMWLKKNKVDLAYGNMINPGSQPTIKEAVRLGMGPDKPYKITFGFSYPSWLHVMVPALGQLANGVVQAGGFPAWDDPSPGMRFVAELQNKYHSGKRVTHIMYAAGIIEAMTQVEALRLTVKKVPFGELTPRKVLENGFYQIKNLNTGGITSTPLTYGKGDVEGLDEVRVDQVKNGKIVKQGTWPCRHLYKKK